MPWDLALILAVLGIAVPWLGARRIRQLLAAPLTTKADRLRLYASTVASQWVAAGVVLWRTGAHGIRAADLGLSIPNAPRAIAGSLLVTTIMVVNQILSLRQISANPRETSKGILPQLAIRLFPQDQVERAAFVVVVATVAICEEWIYRGFAQREFQMWLGGLVAAGIMASASIFAVAHLYQGWRGVVTTFVVGMLFSAARFWTGSLFPTVLAHFLTDLIAGFLAPERLRSALAQPATDLPHSG